MRRLVHTTAAPVTAMLLAGGLAGCGNADRTAAVVPSPSVVAATSAAKLSEPRSARTGDAAGLPRSVCAVLSAARVTAIAHTRPLHASASNSDGLSSCIYSRAGTTIRVLVDGQAAGAQRFADLTAEAVQLSGMYGVGGRPRFVRHVGTDHSGGTAGAYWSPSVSRLTAFSAGHLARVTIDVPDRSDRQLSVIAAHVTSLVLHRLAGTLSR